MSGVLTRAESRALRMTAENGECALEFTRLPPHTYDCHAMHILYLFSTLKALRGFGDTAASVPDDFFCYFFSSLEKKVVLLSQEHNYSRFIKTNLSTTTN